MSFPRHTALALPLLLILCGCGDHGTPRLTVDSQVLDFGVLSDESQSLEIPIVNEGNAPLRIRRISTSCACSLGNAPQEVGPGETAKVVVKTPRIPPGPGSTRVTIESNDPGGP